MKLEKRTTRLTEMAKEVKDAQELKFKAERDRTRLQTLESENEGLKQRLGDMQNEFVSKDREIYRLKDILQNQSTDLDKQIQAKVKIDECIDEIKITSGRQSDEIGKISGENFHLRNDNVMLKKFNERMQ